MVLVRSKYMSQLDEIFLKSLFVYLVLPKSTRLHDPLTGILLVLVSY